MRSKSRYECVKCGGKNHTTGEVRATGGFWSKLFDIQNRRFITVSCEKCGYTEFYNKTGSRTVENILDFLNG